MLDSIIVATTTNSTDDVIVDLCQHMDVSVYRGSEHDVLSRYIEAANRSEADCVIRLTADCPLIDPMIIDQAVGLFVDGKFDYLSNVMNRTYPDGLDTEVMTLSALLISDQRLTELFQREHVTAYIRGKIAGVEPVGFKIGHFTYKRDLSDLRWTVDYSKDLDIIREFYANLPEGFSWLDAYHYQRDQEYQRTLQLRRVNSTDAQLLFEWVNSPENRLTMISTTQDIPWDEHIKWFESRLRDEFTRIWIIETDHSPIGQIRLQGDENILEVDIYLLSKYRGFGMACYAMKEAIRQSRLIWPGSLIAATVKCDNQSSIGLFERAGFSIVDKTKDAIRFNYHQPALVGA